jgi:O-antigen/teichoic acid export membrane protein
LRVIYAIACLAAQLVVPLIWNSGAVGLLVGPIAGYGVETFIARLSRRRHRYTQTRTTGELRIAAIEYRNYPYFDVWATLLRIFAIHGQVFVLAWLYGPAVAGCLMLAQRLIATPISALGFSVSRVYYSEAAAIAGDNPTALRSLFVTTLRRLMLFLAPPLTVVCALAPWTFNSVFGAQWQHAGIYCSMLCPLILLRVISFVLGPTLDVMHRQGVRLAREFACVALIGCGVLMAHSMGWSDVAAVAMTTALGCVGYAISIGLTWQALLAHTRQQAATAAVQSRARAD